MQTKATESNRTVRVRAVLLLAGSTAALAVPALWRPATSGAVVGDPTGLVVVAAGWAAWALTIYLALGTGLAAAGHLAVTPRLSGRLAPRTLRRFVEVAVGASSAAAVCLAPAVAYADAPSPGPAASASPLDWPGLTPPVHQAPVHQAPVHHATLHHARARHPAAVSTQARQRPHVPARLRVRPGDSLWSLTARALGPRASAARIATTWPRLYAANRTAIGADPNLIHPGQELVLPTSEEGTSR